MLTDAEGTSQRIEELKPLIVLEHLELAWWINLLYNIYLLYFQSFFINLLEYYFDIYNMLRIVHK